MSVTWKNNFSFSSKKFTTCCGSISASALSSNNTLLSISTDRGWTEIYNVDGKSIIHRNQSPYQVGSIQFSNNNKSLFCKYKYAKGFFSLIDVAGETKESKVPKALGLLQFTQNGEMRILYVTGCHRVGIWDPSTSTTIEYLEEKKNPCMSEKSPCEAYFLAKKECIVASACDEMIRIHNFNTRKLVCSITTGRCFHESLELSDDGSMVAVLSRGASIYIVHIDVWQIKTKKRLFSIIEPASTVKFAPDNTLVTGSHKTGKVKFWNCVTGELLKTLSLHNDTVSSIEFSVDGSTLVTASLDDAKLTDLWTPTRAALHAFIPPLSKSPHLSSATIAIIFKNVLQLGVAEDKIVKEINLFKKGFINF